MDEIVSCIDIASDERRAKRIKKTIVDDYVLWTSLPHDVLELIHQKLCFTDQVRLRDVCTSWRLSCDRINSSYTLPWVTLYSESFSTVDDFAKLFDPYSKQVYKVDFSRKDCGVGSSDDITVMDSKNGWILFCSCLDTGFVLFLRNPFTVGVILLPELVNFRCSAATFTTNPDSPDCEFLVLCNPYNGEKLCVARFCLSRSKEWRVQYLEEVAGDYSVCFMDRELYCLGFEGVLKSYKLENESWELLTSFLSYQNGCWTWERGSLVENGGDLLMVCKLKTRTCKSSMYDWLVFRFDRNEMSWIVQQNLENTAFFVSGRVLFSASLMEDCLLFELEEDSCGGSGCLDKSYCYSLKERRRVESTIYTWIMRCYDRMILIEPPYLWKW